ncbi:hypothetical protein STEG23_032217 [Scotinomys teguina]
MRAQQHTGMAFCNATKRNWFDGEEPHLSVDYKTLSAAALAHMLITPGSNSNAIISDIITTDLRLMEIRILYVKY